MAVGLHNKCLKPMISSEWERSLLNYQNGVAYVSPHGVTQTRKRCWSWAKISHMCSLNTWLTHGYVCVSKLKDVFNISR